MLLENKKFQGVSRKLLQIHRNEHREAVGSREWEQNLSRYMKRERAKLEVGKWNLKKFGCGRA